MFWRPDLFPDLGILEKRILGFSYLGEIPHELETLSVAIAENQTVIYPEKRLGWKYRRMLDRSSRLLGIQLMPSSRWVVWFDLNRSQWMNFKRLGCLMIRIKQSSPMHTIQDIGRFGFASQGVAHAGPMDSIAACWANWILGNPVNRPFIEIGGGGLVAEFTKSANVAIAGAWGDFMLDGQPLIGPGCYPVDAGTVLKIGRLPAVASSRILRRRRV